jgi:H+-translocating NAD(P) transhydrogenase subunit alpha
MSQTDLVLIGFFIFVLAVFLGLELISKVPSLLHTPLMSGTNFIHGIVVIGAITIASTVQDALAGVIAVIAVFLGTLNVVGGWVVTDRMLGMFRGASPRRAAQVEGLPASTGTAPPAGTAPPEGTTR